MSRCRFLCYLISSHNTPNIFSVESQNIVSPYVIHSEIWCSSSQLTNYARYIVFCTHSKHQLALFKIQTQNKWDAYSLDLDKTAPIGIVLTWSILFAKECLTKCQMKYRNSCCTQCYTVCLAFKMKYGNLMAYCAIPCRLVVFHGDQRVVHGFVDKGVYRWGEEVHCTWNNKHISCGDNVYKAKLPKVLT